MGGTFQQVPLFLYRMNFFINHKTGYAKGLFTNKYFRHESFFTFAEHNKYLFL